MRKICFGCAPPRNGRSNDGLFGHEQVARRVSDNIRKSLDQAGYKDVSVSQDRDKGVVTLSGTVATDSDKSQAESIAKAGAGSQVVADQIAVRPPGNESDRENDRLRYG